MKTALIKDGVVIQVQPSTRVAVLDDEEIIDYTDSIVEGFIEVPDNTVCGMVINGDGTFSNPPPTPKSSLQQIEELENTITTRNILNATLGDEFALAKIADVEVQINLLRNT